MKRTIATILLSIMLASLLISVAFAAGDLNADEQRIFDKLNETIVVCGKTITTAGPYVSQAKTYMIRDDVDITTAQADEIIDYIQQAQDLAKQSTSIQENGAFTFEINNQILELATKAAAVLNCKVVTKGNVAYIYDAEGSLIFEQTPAVKFTGANYTVLYVVVAVLAVALAACVVLTKKFKLAK